MRNLTTVSASVNVSDLHSVFFVSVRAKPEPPKNRVASSLHDCPTALSAVTPEMR